MDYSEELKWSKAKRLLERHESSPNLYGPSLVELDKNSPILSVRAYELPDTIDRRVDFYKKLYWGKACQFYSSFSVIYFIICTSFSSVVADKIFLLTFLRCQKAQLEPNLTISSLSIDSDFISKFNILIKVYGATTLTNYLRVFYKSFVTQLANTKEYDGVNKMWLLRYITTV